MSRRVLALAIASLVLAMAAVGGLAVVVFAHEDLFPDAYGEKGPPGDKGPRGDRGQTGPAGPVGPDAADAVATLESDLAEVSAAVEELSAQVGSSDVESELAQLRSDVEDVSGRFEALCDQLAISEGALYDLYLFGC